MKINRQTGFQIGCAGIVLLNFISCFLNANLLLAYYTYTLFVFCVINVLFDFCLAKTHINENGEIIYNQNIKLWIFVITAIINTVIFGYIGSLTNGDWGWIPVILGIIITFLLYNISFAIGMKLGIVRSIVFIILSFIFFCLGGPVITILFEPTKFY